MAEQKKLFLLDAMALIYRAYFAFSKNPRINSKGLNTSAVLGFANTLYDVLKNEKPTHIGVAFDTIAPTVRHIEFVEYKANREEMPEDLAASIPYIMKLLEAFNIPILMVDGYEADDVIGTLSKRAEKEDFNIYMMTPDKDFGQLVSNKTYIYKPAAFGNKPEILGVKEVCEKFSISTPEQLIELLGLWGDSSDNIPGVPGIGEKTAKKLIGDYGSIENLLQHTYELKGKLRKNLEQYSDQAIVSKQLATIILDVPIEFDEKNLLIDSPNKEALKELFDELEFRAFAKRIFTDLSLQETPTQDVQKTLFDGIKNEYKKEVTNDKNHIQNTAHHYKLIDTPDKREKLLSSLKKQNSFCFDTETTGLDPNTAEIIGISFSFKKGEAFYIPLPENYDETHRILEEFKDVFEDPGIGKTGQNLKYDMAILQWYDIEVKGKIFDTMIAHYLIEPDLRHNMDYLAETYLNYRPVSIESLIGKKGKGQLSMRMVDIEEVNEYACEDADITWQLKDVFTPLLIQNNLTRLFEEIEMPLIPVLASMESEGIKLDIQALNDYSLQLSEEIINLESEIHNLAGTDFNIASPKQLGEILFETLKITDNPKRTKTKQYSTSEDVLTRLLNKHPIIQHILDFRSLSKLKSTYVDSLPRLINPRTGRIHTSFNQAVAATGRLSSNNPNLQNIPIRTEKGREIRKAFVPRNDDYILFAADYSQIELRIIAELSGDTSMLEAFNEGLDIHAATAAKVYDVQLDQVTKEMRRNAKMVNFGIVYGISAFGLSERLNIPRKEAAEIIQQYFIQYPGIKNYMDNTIESARKNGYVETIKNRRRYLRDINSGNNVVRGYAERNAINAPIQGSAADMIKIAMINIYNEFVNRNLRSRMILQVHDELVFDAYKEEVNIIKPIIEEKMQTAIPLKVPIVIDMKTGNNWLEAH
ncbi:DNA polymerase I [candidate division KSB1 bacterium]